MDNRTKLQTLLRELFQFDAADLDFGIYAVLNHKRAEVARFIERDILDAIEAGLEALSAAARAEARAQFDDARRRLLAMVGEAALERDGRVTPAVRSLQFPGIQPLIAEYEAAQAQLADAVLSEDLEAQVYNDLYRFFARYYDDGDFIPLRRYGADDKYAIPYNGEEVLLHWANADQYYVKSGEYFTDYRFRLAGTLAAAPASVLFKLAAATVAQDNVKGERRCFVLGAAAPVTWDAEAQALTIAFEYRPLTDDEKRRAGTQRQQEKLNAEAEAAILRQTPAPAVRGLLAAAEGEGKRTVLAQHLGRYTARNTRDYFIHKDLGRFLARELDFFLANEVLRVDDIAWSQPAHVRRYALRVQTLRAIGQKISAFLAQIEDFQRRLWEKRKFVVESNYCVTLDRVPPELYPEIAANDRQRAEWRKLYGLALGPDADLSRHPTTMVDTAFFDADFTARLLAAFDDLDAACDGLLVHGENYQALRLLTRRYAGQVKCIYIDPPYNTDASPIMYKNGYPNSTWTTMISDRLDTGRPFLADQGIICVTIDDSQQKELHFLISNVLGEDSIAGTIAIRVNPSGRPTQTGFALAHEYAIFARNSEAAIIRKLPRTEEQQRRYDESDEDGVFEWRNLRREGSNSDRSRRKRLWYPIYVAGTTIRVPELRWNESKEEWIAQSPPHWDEKVVWPIDKNGVEKTWRFQHTRVATDLRVTAKRNPDNALNIYYRYKPNPEGIVPPTLWFDSKYSATEHGTALIKELFGWNAFTYPKSIYAVRDCLSVAGMRDPDSNCLDFFAGSGTTAHAVMHLNQEDDGNRKYILIEVGDYFDTVLKPRIQKVAYAADWRDGKPVAGSPGQSHMFHYLRLESYEDTLNNLRFRPLDGPLFAALDAMPDYRLHYMLDYETGGSPSLLDAAQFDRPFAYQLDITRHDATEPRAVDLVTTFNFLLGLRVRTIRTFQKPGFSEKPGFSPSPVVRVTGEDPAGRRVCVLWRAVPPLAEMEAERAWLQGEALAGVAYDLLYINGESALPGSNVLAIEPEFVRLMFEGVR